MTTMDHFDRLPDSLLLIVFNKIGDVKALGVCCLVSRRFHGLLPQVDNVVVKVDCVISDDDDENNNISNSNSNSNSKGGGGGGGVGGLGWNLFRFVVGGIVKPLQAIGQYMGSNNKTTAHAHQGQPGATATHHSPTQVLKHFNQIRNLRIELPSGELGIEDGVLLKWRADFGSTLDNCVILGASSVVHSNSNSNSVEEDHKTRLLPPPMVIETGGGQEDDINTIPESFYTSGGLKLRVVWTISSLIAASARHYLLHPIIAQHHTLDNLVLTDADGQGVLCMNKDQLQELRSKPLSVSTASKRTLVPALNMRLWYAPQLELPDGLVLKGATLVAIRPCDQKDNKSDSSWVSTAFEDEPYAATAVKLLIKRRTYCLEMNSF